MGHRFYVDAALTPGTELVLPDDAGHHLYHVLRLREGAQVTLFNGEPREYDARVVSAGKREVRLALVRLHNITRENPTRIHLGICVLKRDAMTNVLAGVTELGVREVTPIISEHCTIGKKSIRSRQTHWRKTVISACEQCGLNVVPRLHQPMPFDDWINESGAGERLIALPHKKTASAIVSKDIDLLVGPEGGFTKHEEEAAMATDFVPFGLGERILRAQTAPLVAIARLGG